MPTSRRSPMISVVILLAVSIVFSGQPTSAAPAPRCFPEASDCLDSRFVEFWERNGGLAVFGFPIVESSQHELNRDTGATYPTQWLERYRLEYHPENQAPYTILLGRLGEQRLDQLGVAWRELPRASGPKDGCLWFAETEQNICDQAAGLGFKQYWQGHGLEFDGVTGTSYAESLALFGLPLTEPRIERNTSGDTVLTQWFERARFEWHPDRPDEFKVLLGLLASELLTYQPLPGLEGRFAYADTEVRGLKLMLSTANGARQIVLDEYPSYRPAIWSPDGRLIALWHPGPKVSLRGLDVSSGQQTLLQADLNGNKGQPTWSPDSQQLAFDDNYALYTIKTDGSPRQTIMEGQPVIGASWSPNGQEIAFINQQNPQSKNTDVGIVNADGSNVRIVRKNARFIAWSPDGTRFLFQHSEHTDHSSFENANLYVISRDGTGERKLTDYTGPLRLNAHWRTNSEIAILAQTTERSKMRDLISLNVDSGRRETLASGMPWQDGYAWSKDGRFLVFSRDRRLELMDLNDKRVLVLNIDGRWPAWASR